MRCSGSSGSWHGGLREEDFVGAEDDATISFGVGEGEKKGLNLVKISSCV